jgi:hypothetical protein
MVVENFRDLGGCETSLLGILSFPIFPIRVTSSQTTATCWLAAEADGKLCPSQVLPSANPITTSMRFEKHETYHGLFLLCAARMTEKMTFR